MTINEPIFCPVCDDVHVVLLGGLGKLSHFRCGACGVTFYIQGEAVCDDCRVEHEGAIN